MRKIEYKGIIFRNNRKERNQKKMSERYALTVFADNQPYHYMLAKSASLETFAKALELCRKAEEKK